MKEKIKWIIFDLSGVLVYPTLVNPAGYEVGSRYFEPKQLEGIFYEKDYKNNMLGLISHEQLVSNYIKKMKLDMSVEEYDDVLKKDVKPMDGMETLMQELEPKYNLAIGTNEGKVIAKYKVERSGVMQYMSKIVPSYLLRELKPHPAFYKKMLKRLGAKAEECVFTDDRKDNVHAAKMLGIVGIEFANTAQLKQELVNLGII